MADAGLALQRLDFQRCGDVSDAVLRCAADHFPALTNLALPSSISGPLCLRFLLPASAP